MSPWELFAQYAGWIGEYLLQMLPCMLLALGVLRLTRPYRQRRLARLGLHSGPCRETGLIFFVMFCAGLAALTLFPAKFWTLGHWAGALMGREPFFAPIDWRLQLHTIQWKPFREIFRAFHGSWVMFLMLANIGIFSPVGFFSALLWREPRWWRALLIGFFASLFIEFVQFFIGRSPDVDDVLLNTLGALTGYWLYLLPARFAPEWTQKFICTKVVSAHE